MRCRRRMIATLAVLLLLGCQGKPQGGDKLPALGLARDGITVSGISSGGYMAGQFHLAHSAAISGLGIIAAGPYGCAQNSMTTALGPCVKGGVDVPGLVEAARTAAMRGAIDPLAGTRGDRIWLFHGSADEVVSAGVMTAARDFYTSLADPATVSYVDNVPVTHGMPTRSTGASCKQFGRPYLNACDYDAAGEMLKALRGELASPVEARGRLVAFDQSEFGDSSLNAIGYLYVPARCAEGQACSLHIFFHGCDQSAELVGDAVARGAGFNEWAEANALVVLYPQAKSSKLAPLNPLGCWDWWGYTGEDYATRDGAQIKAVQAMVDRLTTPRGGS